MSFSASKSMDLEEGNVNAKKIAGESQGKPEGNANAMNSFKLDSTLHPSPLPRAGGEGGMRGLNGKKTVGSN
jgi:hypothetical protein